MSDIPADKNALLSLIRSDPKKAVELFLERFSLLDASRKEIQSLKERIKELKIRLGKNSQNSSKALSIGGDRKPAHKSLLTPSGKKLGGPKGHDGETLLAVPHPDRVIEVPASFCSYGADLSGFPASEYEARQVFDLPEPRLDVTEYLLAKVGCPSCRKKVIATALEWAEAPTQYGPRVNALLTYLHSAQLILLNQVRQISEKLLQSSVRHHGLHQGKSDFSLFQGCLIPTVSTTRWNAFPPSQIL